MSFRIEKDWTTEAGLRAVAIFITDMGHRCGYVGVPPDHPLHGVDYSEPCPALTPVSKEEPIGKRGLIPILCRNGDDQDFTIPEIVFNVHGGITFSDGNGKYPVEANLWWFGFDCAHSGDKTHHMSGEERTLDYVVAECESLAWQIIDRTKR